MKPSSTFPPGEIHVWDANLDQFNPQDWDPLLSPHEQARASRLQIPAVRDRFRVGRGILRALLGSYLHRDPAHIPLTYGIQGKPALQDPHFQDHISFNVAHTGSLALFALSGGSPLGLDVEQLRPHPHMARLARRRFTPQEYAAFVATEPPLQSDIFLQTWTAKEAALKAQGWGIPQLSQVEWIPGQDQVVLKKGGSLALYQWQPTLNSYAALATRDPWTTLRWGGIQGEDPGRLILVPRSQPKIPDPCDIPPQDPEEAHRDR